MNHMPRIVHAVLFCTALWSARAGIAAAEEPDHTIAAKVNAMIRRAYAYHDLSLDVLEHKGAVLSLKDFSIGYGQHQVPLSKNEFLILKALMEKGGQILSRDNLMRLLWEDESFVDDNTLTVNINRLRKKLESVGLPDWIQTKKKQGYWIP